MAQEFGDGRRPAAAVGRVPAAAARPAGAGRRYRLAARSPARYLGRLNLALLKTIYRPMTDPPFSVDRSWRMKLDWKSLVTGKRVSVRGESGGRRIMKKTTIQTHTNRVQHNEQ